MAVLMRRTKAVVIPAALFCVCCLHVVASEEILFSSNVPDSPKNSLAEDVRDFFRALVRRRRQLPKREDLDKKGFTEIERQALLALHNAHRSTVNPTAANMIELRWNSDIEAFAQDWSERCDFNHRSNRTLGEWKNMGENLFFTSGRRYTEKQAVDLWWNEYRSYTYETKTCEPGKQCGHYITAAWAKSQFFGCGITRCETLGGINIDISAYLFVCNYSGRFFSNTRPYEEGTSCSNCPIAYPRCRYNLCVTDEMLTDCQGYNGTTIYISASRNNSVSDPIDCPGFTVDPVVTTQATQVTTEGQTTESSDTHNTTEADGGSGSVKFSSIPIMVICLSSCFSFVWYRLNQLLFSLAYFM